MDILGLWQKAVDFHGHMCGGLLTGFLASVYASSILTLDFSADEEVVCISENDACGVDAIQSMLGCTVGKGNLLFHMTGKSAYSFYSRKTGKSVRLLKVGDVPDPKTIDIVEYCRSRGYEEIFSFQNTVIAIPERARIFDSYICDCCGENTGANWIRIQNGKKLCLDCASRYDRFRI